MMSETFTVIAAGKACQASKLGGHRGVERGKFLRAQGASKSSMTDSLEQIISRRCLKGGLSGNEQRALATALPTPGGNQ
jgi:hypothetical protein